jgi:hypothetical protein
MNKKLPSREEAIKFLMDNYTPQVHDWEDDKETYEWHLEEDDIACVYSSVIHLRKISNIFHNEWDYLEMKIMQDKYYSNPASLTLGGAK